MPLWLIPVGLVVGYLYWRSHKPLPPAPVQPQQPPQIPQAPPPAQVYTISPTPAAPTAAPTIHSSDTLNVMLPPAPPGQVWAFVQGPAFATAAGYTSATALLTYMGGADGASQIWAFMPGSTSSGGGSGAAILQLFNVNDTWNSGAGTPNYANPGASPAGQPVTINYSYAVP